MRPRDAVVLFFFFDGLLMFYILWHLLKIAHHPANLQNQTVFIRPRRFNLSIQFTTFKLILKNYSSARIYHKQFYTYKGIWGSLCIRNYCNRIRVSIRIRLIIGVTAYLFDYFNNIDEQLIAFGLEFCFFPDILCKFGKTYVISKRIRCEMTS